MPRPGRSWARALIIGTVGLLGAACGAPPPVVDAGKPLASVKIVKGAHDAPPADQQATWQRFVADVNRVRLATTSLRCELTGFYVSIKDGKPGSTFGNFYFEKPSKTALVVLQSSDGAVTGTKIVWGGGTKMAVKTKFLGFWLKTSIDVHHEYAKDQRGYYIDETGLNATLNTLADNRNQVTIEGSGEMDGIPILKVRLRSPRSLKGIASEVFIVDAGRKIPLVREMYDPAGKLVWRMKLDKIVLNTTLSPGTFSVD